MAYAGVSTAISSIFDDDYYNGHWVDHDELRDDIYGDISYVQAIKNAYLLDDWRHGKGGVGQGIVGMTSMLLSIIIGTVMANKVRKNNYPKFHYELAKDDETRSILKQLEQLKNYGIDAPKLIKDLTPSINKILESLSKIDRGYFDNLAAGGLDKANYETCVAIISGYLKSHPKEYNKIIGIINEATLPPEIVKKYGKGNTISFAGAQAIVPER